MEDARIRGIELSYYFIVCELSYSIEEHMEKVLSSTPDGELVGKAKIKILFNIGEVSWKRRGCSRKAVMCAFFEAHVSYTKEKNENAQEFQGRCQILNVARLMSYVVAIISEKRYESGNLQERAIIRFLFRRFRFYR